MSLEVIRPLRIGIIGAGFVARAAHLPGWTSVPGASVVALCDSDRTALDSALKTIPKPALDSTSESASAEIVQSFSDHRVMLAELSGALDAVSVCADNAAHFPIVLEALRTGLHVFCEKPLAINPDEVRQLGVEADSRSLILMARHQLRFGTSAIEAFAQIRSGALGTIQHVNVRALRRANIPTTLRLIDFSLAGGGVALDLGTHALDMALWLLGFPRVTHVSGTVSDRYGRGEVPGFRNQWGEWDRNRFTVEDQASGLVYFENGVTLSLECAWAGDFTEKESGMWCEFIGTSGSYRWTAPKSETTENAGAAHTRRTSQQPPDFAAFAKACREGYSSPIPWTEAIASLEIIQALYASAKMK